jgi:ADP-ribose pyrophosphatase YjhB (NUDIX family)
MNNTVQKNAYLDVNPVIITPDKKIILAKRVHGIVEGDKWHLPGGRVLVGECIESALQRHSKRKTGLTVSLGSGSLEKDLVGIYDDPKRDSREHVISLAFFCKIDSGKIKASYNVDDVAKFSLKDLKGLSIGFDHKKTILDSFKALKRLKKDIVRIQ